MTNDGAKTKPPAAGTAGGGATEAAARTPFVTYNSTTPGAGHQAPTLAVAARALWDRGLAVVPILAGTKRPSIEGWQTRRLEWGELADLLGGRHVGGLGVVAGALSGNLAVLDFDGDGWRGAFDAFLQAWPELSDAPQVATGSGRRHVWVRCPDMPADFTFHAYKRPDLGAETQIELRGNASNCIVPPSPHPSGGRYSWAQPEAELRDVPFGPLEKWLSAWAGERKRPPEATIPDEPTPTPAKDELERAEQALNSLAEWRVNDYDAQEGWLGVGFTLRELGDAGLTLWDTWSQRSPKYKPGMCAKKWATMKPHHGLTLGSLFYWARLDQALAVGVATDPTAPPLEDAGEPPVGGYRFTDMGNAERFVAAWRGKVLWTQGLGWLCWDGKRWATDQLERVTAMAKVTARRIGLEAMGRPDDDPYTDKLRKWWAASENAARVSAMVELAKPDLAVTAERLDAQPYVLNCLNGTLDLRTGELHDHDPRDLLTKLCPVAYHPDATHPVWDQFLADTTGDDEAFGAFLQRAAGYALTGDTGEEAFLLVLGPAATGKSTFIEALLATWGDYAVKASFDTFLARRDVGTPRPDLVALRGARLVAAVETAATRSLDAPLLKEICGGDRVTTRSLYREPITFTPQAKLFLAANECPKLSDLDTGIWRRLRQVPFERVVASPDPTVKATLKNAQIAGPAVLAWAVRGCMDWQRDRLGTCDQVKRATTQLRLEMDPLAEFFGECCVFGPSCEVPAKALRDAYEAWNSENGTKGWAVVGDREWGRRLADKGCERVRRRIGGELVRLWGGVGLAAPPAEPELRL